MEAVASGRVGPQRPEQTGVPLSQMLMHFCQSDLAARLAKPEVYARDWYVKRIPGVKQPEPLLTFKELFCDRLRYSCASQSSYS